MILTTEALDTVIDVPVAMPLTMIRSSDWLVVASFKLLAGQSFTFRNLNLTVIDASVDSVVLPLGNQCNQFNIRLVNNSYGIAYIGIAKDYSASTDPASVTWVGSAVDVVSASSVGVYTRGGAETLEITEAGDYSFIIVNNCESSVGAATTAELYNVDLRMVVTAQVRLHL